VDIWVGESKGSAGRLGLEVITGGITLLGLRCLPGEDDQLGLVGSQPLNIKGLSLLAQVSPPMIDDDTNTACLLAVNSCLLKLSQCETTALAEFAVVAHGLATDGGAEKCKWADAELGGLLFACCASAKFASGLVEPSAYPALPVLSEVVAVKRSVIFYITFEFSDCTWCTGAEPVLNFGMLH